MVNIKKSFAASEADNDRVADFAGADAAAQIGALDAVG
jgi:hypothetical protein